MTLPLTRVLALPRELGMPPLVLGDDEALAVVLGLAAGERLGLGPAAPAAASAPARFPRMAVRRPPSGRITRRARGTGPPSRRGGATGAYAHRVITKSSA
ncbi:hypothetical protein FPZ12_040295 [Amycolatopsis acidicola]|uniref:Uncharacterized protein n=1 Tax=Amycolatopsis acidicola TaxID=2596893 RepID=A0A5N0UQ89_9PSEU|nr:hypothetical protein [Amycolatopsis acidicola]KAA9150839.1 hypothetical protein FPZ12_040295 [Amycolatopsis acidicola]